MAAPIGNNFWEVRSKHGRDILFADPEKMKLAAIEYFLWCKKHPWKKNQAMAIDKALVIAKVSIATPFTMHGLCMYLDCNTDYFREFKNNEEKCTKDFSRVIKWIENVIYRQKFEGAAIGLFNANIISRDLGLIDQVKNTIDIITVEQPDE